MVYYIILNYISYYILYIIYYILYIIYYILYIIYYILYIIYYILYIIHYTLYVIHYILYIIYYILYIIYYILYIIYYILYLYYILYTIMCHALRLLGSVGSEHPGAKDSPLGCLKFKSAVLALLQSNVAHKGYCTNRFCRTSRRPSSQLLLLAAKTHLCAPAHTLHGKNVCHVSFAGAINRDSGSTVRE